MAKIHEHRRAAFGINALSAWLGFGMSLVIEIFGLVKIDPSTNKTPASEFGYVGHYADGLAGAPARVIDLLSYFTIWSQIVVGIVMTMLWLKPNRDEPWLRWLRLSSIMMIIVTGVVYNLLLGPNFPPVGLNKISSAIEHTITPIITVVVFFIWGPRSWFSPKNIMKALLIPIAYVIYTLIRGAIVGLYPYGFFDVVTNGYVSVLVFVGGILVAAIVVKLMLWAYDETHVRKFTRDRSSNELI